MDWSSYGAFLAFAAVLTVIPGPDFAMVTRTAIVGGRRRGRWCAVGVSCSNATQGVAAVVGLSAVIVRLEPLFQAIRWAGVCYLVFLGGQAIRAAIRGRYAPIAATGDDAAAGQALSGWRQGYLINITNPKVLLFYLAVLPQFLPHSAGAPVLLAYALSHAVLGLAYLLVLVAVLARVRRVLTRRAVRRGLDAVSGVVLLAFGARLVTEQG